MLLRNELEKRVPVATDEVKLSADARRMVFKGLYGLPNTISRVGKSGGRTYVEHTYKSGKVLGRISVYPNASLNNPIDVGVGELQNPAALKRANRIEKIARRIKITAAILALGGGIGIGLGSSSKSSTPERHTPATFGPTTTSSPAKSTCEVARKTLYLQATPDEINTDLVEPNKVANVVLGVIYEGQYTTISKYSFVNKHVNLSAPLSGVTIPTEAYITTSFEPPTETTINIQPKPNNTLSVTMNTCAYPGDN
ncbi:MAG TPA: hypothetical protein VMR18_04465 [Candidatus Saccharimonadales bacterium]|nr:hypothetical protein [Candidatus Saccharimonadales bacterium]